MTIKDLKLQLRVALTEAARKKAGEGEIRAEDLVTEVVIGKPEVWKAARQPLAMERLLQISRAVVRKLGEQPKTSQAQAELPFESVPIIKHVPPMIRTKDGWIAAPKATLTQLEFSTDRTAKDLIKKDARTKAQRRAALSMRNLTRIVKYFGKGSPDTTVEAALRLRSEWMDRKRQRRQMGSVRAARGAGQQPRSGD